VCVCVGLVAGGLVCVCVCRWEFVQTKNHYVYGSPHKPKQMCVC